jgi:hypothetical protein
MYDFKNLRPPANYPVYPPYHKGNYIEEYFYKFYIRNKKDFDKTGYTYIPIFWTNIYITGLNRDLIQPYLNALPEGKYFTVSQHDDAVEEILPLGTISFEAGGNKNGIPIPLICSPLDEQLCTPVQKDILCSFVGSILPNSLREKLYNAFKNDFYFSPQHWTNQVQEDRLNHFIQITKRSEFTLCPRGYGAQSYRLYEVLQLGSIPVFVYDKPWFPFESKIDWDSFCVRIHESKIDSLKSRLLDFSFKQKQQMLQNGKELYKKYFTLESVSRNILNMLQNNIVTTI